MKKILLVEDEKKSTKSLQLAFQQEGYDFIHSENGESGLDLIHSVKPDIILLGLMLPDMSGLDICRSLKSDTKFKTTPVIILTALEGHENVVKALSLGADDYILKPCNTLELLARIKSHLKRKELFDSVTGDEEERKKRLEAEGKQKEAQGYAQYLVDSSLDMIISVDQERNIVEFNKAAQKILGFTRDEAIGKKVDFLYADPDEKNRIRDELLATGRFSGEIKNRRKNGEIFPAFLSASILKNPEGTFLGGMGISRDITELKKNQESLRAAKNKAEEATLLKDKFVSLVAHDLKGPLGSMLGYMKLVLMNEPEETPTASLMDTMRKAISSGDNMVRMIDNILSAARLRTGKIRPARAFTDAYFLAVKIMANFSHLASKKGIKLVNNVPKRTRIYADETLIYGVLQNLVTNAIKFSHEGDTVSLFVPPEEPSTIAVSDTGIGIETQRLKKLFRYEEKTSTPGTMGEKGTGFGLPLSKDILEGHGGCIEVESVLKKGSVFYARLPHVHPKVLIVDDDSNTRGLIAEFLSDEEVGLIDAENGEDALKVIKSTRPDLVITDIQMPVMDGFDLLLHLRDNHEYKSTPVIVMTFDGNMETREKAFRMGADDFILKPLAMEVMIPHVRKIIV